MRRVVVLEKVSEDADSRAFRCVFRLKVPAGREGYHRDPALDWQPGEGQTEADRPWRATALEGEPDPTVRPDAAELAALRAGQFAEQEMPVSLSKRNAQGNLMTEAQFRTAAAASLKATYDALQAEVAIFNPGLLYGTAWSDEANGGAGGWVVRSIP